MKLKTPTKTMPVAMTDTGLEWSGFKMFLLIPCQLGAPTPSDIIPEFRRSIKMLYGKFGLDDFLVLQRIVHNRIINGLTLVN